jgi:hypothetical protein
MPETLERLLIGVCAVAILGLAVLIVRVSQAGPSVASPAAVAPLSVPASVRPILSAVPVSRLASNVLHTTPAGPDERYFSKTGFRVDDDTIWDYFTHRGGVATFGYPISRAFTLDGLTVQLFQRRIIQIDGNHHARLLNVLDPNLLPYSDFDGSTYPAYDRALVATAPSVTDVPAVLAWVHAHAPDTFQDRPVHFYRTFLNTVSPTDVATGTGTSDLLAGFALEMWGIPTSAPQVDPHDHNVIYLRFQRGIMQYDAACGCTQGVMLVDHLKSILTGANLGADLDREARANPLYRQYDPGAPRGLRRPSLFPGTDLTNAFEPQGG